MKRIQEVDLTQAGRVYAIANTPLFLIRRLSEDIATREITGEFEADQILSELRAALEREPKTAEDYVRPYVYLVALSRQETDHHLRAALNLPNSQKWDWFDYIRRVLLQTYVPTNIASVVAPQPTVPSGRTIHSSAPVSRAELKMS